MSINKVILVGNVGKDPVIRYFDKGAAKATFPLATSETYTNQQGETITSTEWHNIVLWRSLAEVAEKTVRKGSQLYIVGKIKTRTYVDKDGVNKYITEILADTLLVLEKKQPPLNSGARPEQTTDEASGKNIADSSVSESPGAYQSSSNNQTEKGTANNDATYTDRSQDNDPFTSQSEDDLPF